MTKKTAKGDMPFLDHLEELRWRILWSLAALLLGAVISFYLVQRFDVLELLKLPIAPYLPEGKLFVTRPTDAFLITLKLAIVIGAVMASPVIFAQVWRFLSPALYEHEKRYIVPALIAGLGLFSAGVLMAYLWVLPAVFKILYGFQYGFIEWIITADAYFSFATRLILAFGLMFQLPLVMVMLSVLDLIRPQTFAKHRPIALAIGAIVAALLTPPDVFSMLMMMLPILLLYEAGILVARLLGRRRTARRIGEVGVLLALLVGAPGAAAAQIERPDPEQRDSTAMGVDSLGLPIDTATARKLGLPGQPSRMFPAVDSIMRELMDRGGFGVTRYAGDSITLFGETQEIVLVGSAMVEREGTTLEAKEVSFQERECRLVANGDPALFEQGTVLVGEGMRYDTCERIGTVEQALTSFQQSGVTWFLRGGLEVDSASTRIYGASNKMTSCSEPSPHYHFSAHSVKWVSNTIMVARPAVLYVRDVPVMWLPFIFQDMRQGRRSGLLVPRFGISDLIRPSADFQRGVTNVGFYVALNDYLDFQTSVDWYSGAYIGLNGQLNYRWLDRFVTGGLAVSHIWEDDVEGVQGDRALRLQWNHQQSFDQRTRLTASVDFATKSSVVQRNTADPFVQTATLSSRLNFNKQFSWGTFAIGGSRTQDLSNGTVNQTLPTVTLTPSPINIGSNVTWSPGFSFTNTQAYNLNPRVVDAPPVNGLPQVDTLYSDGRTTNFSLRTPLRIGRWNWQNDIAVSDVWTSAREPGVTFPDPSDPADSVTRFYGEDFRTGVDWNTGINLPVLFSATWKLQPGLGIRNVTSGPFLLRSRNTAGEWVSQGKRLSFSVSSSPTLFGFFPGFGPYSRIRHSLSPALSWNYAPSAEVPAEYAAAVGLATTRSPALHRVSLGLSQTFEAKVKQDESEQDSTGQARPPRKVKLLSIQTSPLVYDFEQAKELGRNGWATQRITNSLTSDLLRGFTLSMTHDLWKGTAGWDTTRFDPFLTSLSMRFSLSQELFGRLFGLFTGDAQAPPEPGGMDELALEESIQPPGSSMGPSTRLDRNFNTMPTNTQRAQGLRASLAYDLQRTRPRFDAAGNEIEAPANQTLGISMQFSPTEHWNLSWNTQYNFTRGEFGQHVLRLDRDLHRWRLTFGFMKAPNGNVAFNFFISLRDQPEIRFQYDQRTVR
ncbi:MAG: twin-arginine translocase subunit TatC [Gemmatimonadota bacterium]|nr:MAG: twin-arginine translocase subunit TatC [Gemmatimonadota bacterium]